MVLWDLIWGYSKGYLDHKFCLEISFKMNVCSDLQNQDLISGRKLDTQLPLLNG